MDDDAPASEEVMTNNEMDTAQTTAAVAVLHPTEGNSVEGTVTFTKAANGVRVTGDVTGLSQGKHGFHIHQYGDCRAADGTSAGGHFNPAGNQHAARTAQSRHMGDMGNIEANSQGSASVTYVDSVINLNQIIGRAVVIHGGEDDLSSQPSGAAGPRKACGVIGIANADTPMNNTGRNTEGGN